VGVSVKVLITGVAGYIGSVLAALLVRKGYAVAGADSLVFGGESLLPLIDEPGFSFHRVDLSIFEQVVALFERMRPSDVVHLAGLVGDAACAADPVAAEAANWRAVENLVSVAAKHRIRRFVFASSCSVYGDSGPAGAPVDETWAPNPASEYARSKLTAEQLVLRRDIWGEEGTPTVLRLASAYGVSPRMRFDLIVNALALKTATNSTIEIINPHAWRPFCHVRDLAAAVETALGAPEEKIRFEIFNVGGVDCNLRLGELGKIATRCNRSVRITSRTVATDVRSYRVDFAKIADVLGFTCQRDVETSMSDLVFMLKNGLI
jgi:nucleoside-diphosphate-sugar epimerase